MGEPLIFQMADRRHVASRAHKQQQRPRIVASASWVLALAVGTATPSRVGRADNLHLQSTPPSPKHPPIPPTGVSETVSSDPSPRCSRRPSCPRSDPSCWLCTFTGFLACQPRNIRSQRPAHTRSSSTTEAKRNARSPRAGPLRDASPILLYARPIYDQGASVWSACFSLVGT